MTHTPTLGAIAERFRRPTAALAAFAAATVFLGCASSGGTSDPSRLPEARPAVGASTGTSSRANEPRSASGWTVLIERFDGSNAVRRATLRARELAPLLGKTPSVRVVESGAIVTLGAHANPGSRAAQEDLRVVQQATLPNGGRPYVFAFMIPPAFDADGNNPRFNLENAAQAATRPVKYTLQIEQYDAANRAERARLAEQRVLELRRSGEQAFYYHGPRLSIVTIGLFGDEDYDASLDRPSDRLLAIQAAYPDMALNGRKWRVTRMGGSSAGDWQRSVLVRLPNVP